MENENPKIRVIKYELEEVEKSIKGLELERENSSRNMKIIIFVVSLGAILFVLPQLNIKSFSPLELLFGSIIVAVFNVGLYGYGVPDKNDYVIIEFYKKKEELLKELKELESQS